MKHIKYYLGVVAAVLLMGIAAPQSLSAAESVRFEPAFWWIGMKNPELQIMVHGQDIASQKFSLEYPGVYIKEIVRTENPNYLFIYLDITPKAKAGTMELKFTNGKKEKVYPYNLLERNKKKGALGFNTSDVLYLITPDRFANGDALNDTIGGAVADRTRSGGRHGGDLRGVINQLDYLNDLGITAIWLNPVVENDARTYHGYSAVDFYSMDPRYGTMDEYIEMVDKAHQKGMKVVMDMIFNHCGSNHWWLSDIPSSDWFNSQGYANVLEKNAKQRAEEIKKNGGKAPQNANAQGGWQQGQRPQQGQGQQGQRPQQGQQGQRPQGQGQFAGMGRGNNVNDGYVGTSHNKWTAADPHATPSEKDAFTDGWFNRGMPDLNQKNRHMAVYLIQNSIWWIEFARIDAIRQDTHPYADYDFMSRWCKEVAEEYPDFSIVGETWYPVGSAFAAFWQKNSLVSERNSNLKVVMDFNMTFTCQHAFEDVNVSADGSSQGLFKIYEALAQDFLFTDKQNILVFLDNHDLSRFCKKEDPDLRKFKQGMAFLLTTRGIPQIYYGTEIAMNGSKDQGGDGAVRADFPGGWKEDPANAFTAQGRTAQQNEAWDYLHKLLQWRKTSEAVISGDFYHYAPLGTNCYVYARIKDNHRVMVILNGSDKDEKLQMKRYADVIGPCKTGVDVVSETSFDLTDAISVPARGSLVLVLK